MSQLYKHNLNRRLNQPPRTNTPQRALRRWWMLGVVALLLLAGCRPIPLPDPTAAAEPATGAAANEPESEPANDANDTADTAAGQESEADLRPIRLGVGYVPSVQFATFYVAMEKGFYAEEGLDVSLEYGFENDFVKLVGVGERQFMVGSGEQVILGRSQELPLRYVMSWYSKFPVVVFAPATEEIDEPADLAGKRVGIPGRYGASYVAYRGILEAGGLTEEDVQTETIGFTQATAVSEGTVDAAVDYVVNGPVQMSHQGTPVTIIALDSYLRVPSNGLVTNEATLEEEPELVRSMVRASLRGMAYTLENPDEAFDIALDYVPEAGGENAPINRAIYDATLPFWQAEAEMQPGETRPEDWETAVEFMQRIEMIQEPVAVDELYTHDYLP